MALVEISNRKVYWYSETAMNFKPNVCRVLTLKNILAVALFALTCANSPIAAVEAPTPEFNRRATATAQILAGITPNPADPALARLLELDAWKEHQKWMMAQWSEVRGRIKTVESWREQELKIANASKKNPALSIQRTGLFQRLRVLPGSFAIRLF